MAKERIGIMGGTFNPIHQGHVAMAQAAIRAADLDRVLFIPTGQPPHKQGVAPAEDRWRMVCSAIAEDKRLEPCRIELDREGTTYTLDTLNQLAKLYPKSSFFYIIGEDTLLQLKSWYCADRVLGLCSFLICPRAGTAGQAEIDAERRRLNARGGRFLTVEMDRVDISSTELREALKTGASTPLMHYAVREYALIRGLYGYPGAIRGADEWMERLFRALTRKRFVHTLGVCASARHLARRHGIDETKTVIAALLHDCAKCMPLKEMQRIAIEQRLTDDRSILASGALLHAIAGSWIASHEYGVTDPEILDAIACHTTGKPGMTPMDMAVYLADKIEPGRPDYPLLSRVRRTSEASLEQAMLLSMAGTVGYVRQDGKQLHPQTLHTLDWLQSMVEIHSGSSTAVQHSSKKEDT
ncbi:MAG: nicotinate-nucleotide adenylyltransferase [Clostridia bacterium]|nr:nicotinate-nucleotide adenylyltransferase [Clostridia bacterium]